MSYWSKRYQASSATSGSTTSSAGVGFDVFLLVGQSNMVGFSAESADPLTDYTSPNVLQFGQSTAESLYSNPARAKHANVAILAADPLEHAHGPQRANTAPSIGTAFSKLYEPLLASGRKLLLVPCAMGGSGFSTTGIQPPKKDINDVVIVYDWFANKPGNLWELAMKRTRLALAYHPLTNPTPAYDAQGRPPAPHPSNVLKGILWHQGEADYDLTEEQYKPYLQDLFASFRTLPGASSCPIIAGYPNNDRGWGDPENIPAPTGNAKFGPLKVLSQIANVQYFGIDKIGFANSYFPYPPETESSFHFTREGYRELGRRFFDAYLSVTQPTPKITQATAVVPYIFDDINDGMTIAWSTNATFLDIYVKDANNTRIFSTTGVPTANLTYSVPASLLQQGATYTVDLYPRSTTGAVGPKKRITTTMSSYGAVFVANLVATSNAFANGFTLSWSSKNTTVATVSFTKASSPGQMTTFANTSDQTITIPPTALSSNTSYVFTVVPYYFTFPGNSASLVSATLVAPVPALSNVAVTPRGNNYWDGYLATWTASNATNYVVSYGAGANATSFTPLANTTSTSLEIPGGTLASNTQYAISVVAWNYDVYAPEQKVVVTTPVRPTLSTMSTYVTFKGSASAPVADAYGKDISSIGTPSIALLQTRGRVLDGSAGGLIANTAVSNSYTIAAWLYPVAYSGTMYPWIAGNGFPSLVTYRNSNSMNLTNKQTDASNNTISTLLMSAIAPNVWTHVAWTYDRATAMQRFYINGNVASQSANSAMEGVYWSGCQNLRISGSASLGSYWNGYIDDVRLYDWPLAVDDAKNLANLAYTFPNKYVVASNVTAVNGADFLAGVTVNWTAANALCSTVSYKLANNATYTDYATVFSGPLTISSAVLLPSTAYDFRVTPRYYDWATTSGVANVTTESAVVPTANNATVTSTGVYWDGFTVNWTSTNATLFDVSYAVYQTGDQALLTYTSLGNTSANSFSVAGGQLGQSTTYTIRVTPYAGAFQGAPTYVATTVPAAPSINDMVMNATFKSGAIPTVDQYNNAFSTIGTLSIASVAPRGNVLNTTSGALVANEPLGTSFTVSMWLYPTTLNGTTYPFQTGGSANIAMYKINGTTNLVSVAKVDGISTTNMTVIGFMSNTAWTHYAWSYDHSKYLHKFYKNGNVVLTSNSSATVGSNWIGSTTAQFRISGSTYWPGYVDDVRLYNWSMRDADVAALYSSTILV